MPRDQRGLQAVPGGGALGDSQVQLPGQPAARFRHFAGIRGGGASGAAPRVPERGWAARAGACGPLVPGGFWPLSALGCQVVDSRGWGKPEPENRGGPGQTGTLRCRTEEARRMMAHPEPITGTGLRTPRAAAAAGIAFSLLLGLALVLLIISAPSATATEGAWLTDTSQRATIAFALNLVPFAGIA